VFSRTLWGSSADNVDAEYLKQPHRWNFTLIRQPAAQAASVWSLRCYTELQMQTRTRYIEGKKFETTVGRHRIISDQPVSQGGTDAGVTPPELLLASLGTCAGHYAAEYLRTRSLPLAGLEIHVSAEKGAHPARLASFRIEVSLPEIEERHRQGLFRAVKACMIHNTLTTSPVVDVEVSVAKDLCAAG
jgi:putative redox protein